MSRAFLTRAPNANELLLLKKFIASYRDGSGGLREGDGTTRAEYRQIERCFAELLHGKTTENKDFYDFYVESNEAGGVAVRGASLKTKESKEINKYTDRNTTIRAYLELSNSSAKDWEHCANYGLTADNFKNGEKADIFGKAILERQIAEKNLAELNYLNKLNSQNKKFIQQDCVYISLLYSPAKNGERNYLISSFNANLPAPQSWLLKGKRLVGIDSAGKVLYDWYALSGGQFKYYPLISDRLHGTQLFDLQDLKPTVETLRAKVSRLFGD